MIKQKQVIIQAHNFSLKNSQFNLHLEINGDTGNSSVFKAEFNWQNSHKPSTALN